jgi:hypothetical protein
MINLFQLTSIFLQNLVSLCSYLVLDMPIIFGFIFTCFVSSVSLTLIYLAAPVGRWVWVNGRWVFQAIITGAVGGATNAGIQRFFPAPSPAGDGGNNGSGNNNSGNSGKNTPSDNNPGNNNPGDKAPSDNNPGSSNPEDKAPSDNKPGNNNPGDTGNNKPGNTEGKTGDTNNTGGNTGGKSTTGSSS